MACDGAAIGSDLVRLVRAFNRLEPDAKAVLVLIGERMVAGQAQYGALDVSGDKRNMIAETLEEFADAAVYLAIEMLRRSRG